MALTLQIPQQQSIVLPNETAEALIRSKSGDAALLYLTLLRYPGEDPLPHLRFTEEQLMRAQNTLIAAGLVSGEIRRELLDPVDERPTYTSEDVTRQITEDKQFSLLTANVEQMLGKRLSTPDLNILLGLYDYLGLPCEVIFLLVNHCTERVVARYGPGRRPTLRQIEKEGYAWARRGLLDLTSANDYLMRYASRLKLTGQYLSALGIHDRRPSPTEERYLMEWAEMGFEGEAVTLAYDKTILKCKELRWPYLNKILKNWHDKGLHTIAEIQEGDRLAKYQTDTPKQQPEASSLSNTDRMKRYLQQQKEG